MGWSLHIAFRLAAGHRIVELQEPAVIRQGPPKITLFGLSGEDRSEEQEQVAPGWSVWMISTEPQNCALGGYGYPYRVSAEQDGQRWLDALRVHFVEFMRLVDFGDPKPEKTATELVNAFRMV